MKSKRFIYKFESKKGKNCDANLLHPKMAIFDTLNAKKSKFPII